MSDTSVEDQRRKRIRVLLAAAAYEIHDSPIINDAQFDDLAKSIDPSIDTGRPNLDEWFRKEFAPYTGSWIRTFPELDKINALLYRFWRIGGQR